MLAFLGFSSQAAVQGKGPIECLQAHLADPGHNNSELRRRCAAVYDPGICALPHCSAAKFRLHAAHSVHTPTCLLHPR